MFVDIEGVAAIENDIQAPSRFASVHNIGHSRGPHEEARGLLDKLIICLSSPGQSTLSVNVSPIIESTVRYH